MGRHTVFTKAMGDRICQGIRAGKSLSKICQEEGMPEKSQVLRWRGMPSLQKFRNQYDLAVQDRTDAWAEQVIDIADDGENDTYIDGNGNVKTDFDVVQRSKLRVDTRLKLMSKLAPRKYGDRLDITSDDEQIVPLMVFNMRPAEAKKPKKTKKE